MRRIAAFAASIAALPLSIFGGAYGFIASMVFLVASLAVLRSWRCPRCRQPFAGTGLRSWPDSCVSCGLPDFAPRAAVELPVEAIRLDRQRLSFRVRRAIAGGEMVTGVGAMILAAVYGMQLGWWYTMVLQGLGAVSIYAGWHLWRDNEEGYRLTRWIQAAQLIKPQGALGAFAISAGFEIDLLFRSSGFAVSSGLWSNLTLAWGRPLPFQFSFNILAAALLFSL
jgi:hypothetical protein